jgi:hypothetical protein
MKDVFGYELKNGDLVYWLCQPESVVDFSDTNVGVGEVLWASSDALITIKTSIKGRTRAIMKRPDHLKKLTDGEAMLWKLENTSPKFNY